MTEKECSKRMLLKNKIRTFEKNFPHKLKSNEWQVKWPIKHKNGKTYNPDYWCKALDCFIELTTSYGNICAEGRKWSKAIRKGYPLRIYWWQGKEITQDFI